MTQSWLSRSRRGIAFLFLLCLSNAVLAASRLPPASLYGSLLSNLSRPYEHDAFVQLAAPYLPELNSPITRNNSFSFTDLKVAEYVLSVHSRLVQFQFYSVNVTPSHQVDVRFYLPGRGPTKTKPLPQPLLLRALHLKTYTTEPTPFSPFSLLKSNPTLILAFLALLSLILLPKLLAHLDPQTANELNQTQAELHSKLARFTTLGAANGSHDFLTQTLSKRLAAKKDSVEVRSEENEVEVDVPSSGGSAYKLPNQGTQSGKGKGKGGKKRK